PKIKFEIDRDLKRYPLLVTVLLGYRHLLVFRKLRFNAHDQDKNHSDLFIGELLDTLNMIFKMSFSKGKILFDWYINSHKKMI
ncbi:MAG: hypothetical protein ACXVCP_15085, partial [Bdellovibrio sp.]